MTSTATSTAKARPISRAQRSGAADGFSDGLGNTSPAGDIPWGFVPQFMRILSRPFMTFSHGVRSWPPAVASGQDGIHAEC